MEYDAEIASVTVWNETPPMPAPVIRELDTFCDWYNTEQKRACYWYLPFILADTYIVRGVPKDTGEMIERVWQICRQKSGQDRRSCVFGIGAYQFAFVSLQPTVAAKTCEQLPEPADRASCVYGTMTLASNFSRPNSLVAFCNALTEPNIRTLCFKDIFLAVRSTPELHTSVSDVRRLCSWTNIECASAVKNLNTTSWDAITEAFPL